MSPAYQRLTWWQSNRIQALLELKTVGIQNYFRLLPDKILWLQWMLWHPLSTTCYRLLLWHFEILPACLGLPFKDLSDSKNGLYLQDELGGIFFEEWLSCFITHYRYETIS